MCAATSRNWRDSRDADRRGNDVDRRGNDYDGSHRNYHTDEPDVRRTELRRPRGPASAIQDDDYTPGRHELAADHLVPSPHTFALVTVTPGRQGRG